MIIIKSYSSSCGKKIIGKSPKASLLGYAIQIQKEVISNPKQPSCKKRVQPQKGYGEKIYEIQGGGQEMAVIF